jgi:hypothetical protein
MPCRVHTKTKSCLEFVQLVSDSVFVRLQKNDVAVHQSVGGLGLSLKTCVHAASANLTLRPMSSSVRRFSCMSPPGLNCSAHRRRSSHACDGRDDTGKPCLTQVQIDCEMKTGHYSVRRLRRCYNSPARSNSFHARGAGGIGRDSLVLRGLLVATFRETVPTQRLWFLI